jgi:hypothetical protein
MTDDVALVETFPRMSARKGLKRAGLRSYAVDVPRKRMIIERDRPWRFLVRPAAFPHGRGEFFSQKFKRLWQARAYAEVEAGLA